MGGEIWTQPKKCIFCKWLVHTLQPIYYTDQIQRCLDSIFRKRSSPKICEEEMEDREQRLSVSNTKEGSRAENV